MTVQPTFVATLIDEWVRGGVRHAVIAPGSRSSALTTALASDDRLTIHMRLDERSAAFFAIGLAKATDTPVVIVTTSGTAAPELHAAVVEADLTNVPLIVATTDRPIELHEVGASQTIDQVGLFGRSTRLAINFGVAEQATEPMWRSMASQLVVAATSSPNGPGPVQANIAFREPFVGVAPAALPTGRDDGEPWHQGHVATALSDDNVALLCSLISGPKGMVVVGEGAVQKGDPTVILALAELLSWPVIADPRAFPRVGDPRVISFSDGIYRSETARKELRPDVILRLGDVHLSKTFATFLSSLRGTALDISVTAWGRVSDPDRMANHLFAGDPTIVAHQCLNYLRHHPPMPFSSEWFDRFSALNAVVGGAIATALDEKTDVSEPGLLREIFASVPNHSTMVVSASMPVRDLEWFGAPRTGAPNIVFNGGANGIDGVISTVLGVAAGSTSPVTGVMGDLSFFHDLSGLVWGELEVVPTATIVVIDNHGGGIFSFLDQKRVLDTPLYERTMGTPQRSDPAEVARSLGCHVVEAGDKPIAQLLADSYAQSGISVIVVRTDRDENIVVHAEIEAAVRVAVDAELTKAP